jgi:hypothetical protein
VIGPNMRDHIPHLERLAEKAELLQKKTSIQQ